VVQLSKEAMAIKVAGTITDQEKRRIYEKLHGGIAPGF
jgi:hypothetical protein